jgi:hypothetical protein
MAAWAYQSYDDLMPRRAAVAVCLLFVAAPVGSAAFASIPHGGEVAV